MSYFIGWCHKADGPCKGTTGSTWVVYGLHWHYWNGSGLEAGIVDAKRFKTYEAAEDVVAELLLLHPDRLGEISIETFSSALDRGRV